MKEILTLSNLPLLLAVSRILARKPATVLFLDGVAPDDMSFLHRVNDIFPEEFKITFFEDGISVSFSAALDTLMRLVNKHASELEAAIQLSQDIVLKNEF